jgi:5-methyltetrahydropteroyltriglutamate--homocysteine methyltransferase
MALKTATTGSFPPTFDVTLGLAHLGEDEREMQVRASIERAVRDQIELGLDILVDGQPRDDIISLYTRRLAGFDHCALPCRVVGQVGPADGPITVADFVYARRYARQIVGDRPFKAHLTGPLTLARSSQIASNAGYANRNDPRLAFDLAHALAREARWLGEAGAELIQIDEPVLKDGVDRDAAFEAQRIIVEEGQIARPLLHVCGNVTHILKDILHRSPARIVCIEGAWLDDPVLAEIDRQFLADGKRQIGLGCVYTNNHTIERATAIQSFLDRTVPRLGEDQIWAVTPNCGMRMMNYECAYAKLKSMISAVRSLSPQQEIQP